MIRKKIRRNFNILMVIIPSIVTMKEGASEKLKWMSGWIQDISFLSFKNSFWTKSWEKKLQLKLSWSLFLRWKWITNPLGRCERNIFVWNSTMRAIVSEISDCDNFCQNVLEEAQYHPTRQDDVKNWIKEYICDKRRGVTAKKIRDHVINTLSKAISLHEIRRYLKQKLKLSFKKGRSRPTNIDRNRASLLGILYTIRLAKTLNDKILINQWRWKQLFKWSLKWEKLVEERS